VTGAGSRWAQFGLMPADLITLAHLSVSSAMNFPNSTGDIGTLLSVDRPSALAAVGATALFDHMLVSEIAKSYRGTGVTVRMLLLNICIEFRRNRK
jgi:hypothetical protein